VARSAMLVVNRFAGREPGVKGLARLRVDRGCGLS
jgi:hypothetical protein